MKGPQGINGIYLLNVCHFSYLVVGRLNCGVGHMLLELVLPLKKEVWSLKNRVPQKYMTFSLVPTTVKVDPAEIRVTSLSLMDFTTWKRWQTCDMTFFSRAQDRNEDSLRARKKDPLFEVVILASAVAQLERKGYYLPIDAPSVWSRWMPQTNKS